jgi:hypothetical protein
MRIAALLTVLLFITFIPVSNKSAATKSAATQPDTRRPEISVAEALDIAEKYVGKHQVDITGKYIDSVRLNLNPQSTRGKYWIVSWELDKFVKGGQTYLHIYMDKSVEVRFGE